MGFSNLASAHHDVEEVWNIYSVASNLVMRKAAAHCNTFAAHFGFRLAALRALVRFVLPHYFTPTVNHATFS